MAEITQGDTHPPLRGAASDDTGLLDLRTAAALEVHLKQKVTTGVPLAISGPAVAIWPFEVDSSGKSYNWRHVWAAGETDLAADYDAELKVTWDAASVPPRVQWFPHGVLTVKPRLAP